MTPEQPQETFSRKLSNVLNRYAIWPTFFVAILLLLGFYSQFLITDSAKTDLFCSVQHFFNEPLPLWNPHLQSGLPALSQPGAIGHLNIIDSALFFLLSPVQPYVPDVEFIYLLLNLLLFCGFTFVFLRRNRVAPLPAAFVSIMVLFMPQYVINIVSGQWIEIMALSLLPVTLYFSHLLFSRRRLIWWVLTAFFFTFQALRGSVAISAATALIMFTFMFIRTLSQSSRRWADLPKNLGLVLGIWVFAFLAAGYVYFPFVDLFRYSTIEPISFAFRFNDFFLYLVPSFNGTIVFTESQIIFYFGVLLFFLAGFGVLLRRDALVFGLVGLCLVLLLLEILNYPQLAVYALPYAVALLSAFGIDALVRYRQKMRDRQRSRWLDVYMLMVLSLFAVFVGTLLINETHFMRHILQEIPLLTLTEQHAIFLRALTEAAIIFAVIGFTFMVVRLFLRDLLSASVFIFVLLVTGLAELAVVDYTILSQVHPPAAAIPATVQDRLQQDDSLFRIFLTDPHRSTPFYSVTGKSTLSLSCYKTFLEQTGLNVPDRPWMRNPFFAKYTRLVFRGEEIVEQPIPVQNIKPDRLLFDRAVLDLLNVKYILCHSPIHDPNYPQVTDSSMYVYENKSVLPRAFFVDSVDVMPGSASIFDAMDDLDFDPRRVAFVEQQLPFQVENADSNSVKIETYNDFEIQLQAHVESPTMLVLSEVYYPAGWRLFVNGEKTAILRTNSFMRGVLLTPGDHTLRFLFLPVSFMLGKWSSLVAAVLLFAGLVSGLVLLFRKPRPTEERHD